MSEGILISIIIFLILKDIRNGSINAFKIGYYETKLELKGCDIDHVKNIGFFELFKR